MNKKNTQFSPEGLAHLHEAMAHYIQTDERPGLVTLVSRNGETHVDAIGKLAFAGDHPMRRDTIFRIASISKPIVAAAMLTLVQEGKVALHDAIDRWLPELANRRVLRRLDGPLDDTVPAQRPIIVRDLLTMTMGLGAIMEAFAPEGAGRYPIMNALFERKLLTPFHMPKQASADEWVAELAKLPLMDQPGEVWRYDTSITLLGALIERVTRKTLEDALRARIFNPLGMNETSFAVSADKLHRLPVAYQENATGTLEVWDPSGPESFFAKMPGFPGAHGGLTSTADDYLKFAQMLLDGGRVGDRRVLDEKLVDAMMSDQIPEPVKARSPFAGDFWSRRGWGYGLSIVNGIYPGEARGAGWNGGYGTVAYWDPSTRVVAILLSQRLVASPEHYAVVREFFDGTYAAANT